jgi:PleD family two-component response regulator
MVDRISDAFIQEENNRGHRFGGIGLGLAITQRLVELQKGRITAESAGRGQGATFRIELPLASAIPALESGEERTPSGAPSSASRRILLIEDHEQTRSTLTQLLQRRGHMVEGAGTIKAARERAAAGGYDLIVSDLGLPDGDGHKLVG